MQCNAIFGVDDKGDDAVCNGELVYVADHGAPGIGQSWKCKECGKAYVKVGGTIYDPEECDGEPPWILDPSDCV